MLKKAFHFANAEDWIERIPEWFIRLFGFVIAVGPVLTVTGWFYFAGNVRGPIQPYALSGDVAVGEHYAVQRVRTKDPVEDKTEYANVM
jgi:hypothetical protein